MVPGATDVATFTGAEVTNPNLSASSTIEGLNFSTTTTTGYTLSATTSTLTLTNVGTGATGAIEAANTAGTNTISAPLILGGGAASHAEINQTAGGLMSISGNISSSANTEGISISGAGTVSLSGMNTYIGSTAVAAGILNIRNSNALGNGGTASVASGATLQIQNNITETGNALTISGAGATGTTGALENVSGANIYGGLVTLGAAATVSSDAGSLAISNTGTITGSGLGLTLAGAGNGSVASIIGTGAGTVTKTGAGTWSLSGTNTYSGGTTISGGELSVASVATNLGTGTVTLAGGELLTTTSSSAANNVTLNAGTDTVAAATGTSATYDGAVSGNGTLTVGDGTNAGTVILAHANTYMGGTTVNSGTLTLTGAGTLGNNAGTLAVNTGGTVNLGGTSRTVGNFTGTGGTVTTNTVSATITIGSGNGTGGNFAGALTNGTGAGVLSVTKVGTGAITLSGANTYTGMTTVTTGTLNVSGSTAAGSAVVLNGGLLNVTSTGVVGGTVAVNNTAALAGTGTTGAVTMATGGKIDLTTDGAIGTLQVASLTTNGGNLSFEIGGTVTNTDKIASSGALTIGAGGASITVANLGGTAQNLRDGTYTLLSYAATMGTFNGALTLNTAKLDNQLLSLVDPTSTVGSVELLVTAPYTLTTTAGGGNTVNIHLGGTTTLATTVTNNSSTDNLNFSGLTANATSGTVGMAAAGTMGTVAASQTSTPAASQTFTGTTAGAVTIGNTAATVTDTTTMTDISGAGNTVGATVNVYRLASVNTLAPATIAYGNFHVGMAPAAQTVAVMNTAANDGFSEKLDAGATTTGGATVSGSSISLLAPGSSANLTVGITNAAGDQSGMVVVALTSNGTGTSGLGNTALPSQPITVTGTGYNLAQASTIAGVDLGNVHVGGAFVNQALSVTNLAPADGFSEGLDATVTPASGPATATGSITLLGPGLTDNTSLIVNASAARAGALGTVTVGLTSDGTGTSGLGTTALPSQTIAVSGGVYDYANAKYTGTNLNFGNVHQTAASTVVSQTVAFGNQTVTSAAYQDLLNVSATTDDALVTAVGFTGLGASTNGTTTDNLTLSEDSSTLGSLISNETLSLDSDGTPEGLGVTVGGATVVGAPPTPTITTSGQVYSGQSSWNTNGSGVWGSLTSNFGVNWGVNQGSPGLDPGFVDTDTATFDNTALAPNTSATVTLDDGTNPVTPSLKAITFNTSGGGYNIAPGAGGSLKLNSDTGTAAINDLAGSNTISAAIELESNTAVTVTNSGDTLALSGPISDDGGSRGLTLGGAGTLALSGANTYRGATTATAGTISLTGSLAGSSVSTSGSGIITESTAGVISGSGVTFTQGSTGTSTLAGANTYSGITTANAGTLLVNGSINGTAQVNQGATLGGSGALGAVANNANAVELVNNGTLNPSSTVGSQLTVNGGFTQSQTGNLVFSTTNSTTSTNGVVLNNPLKITGGASLAGGITVTNTNFHMGGFSNLKVGAIVTLFNTATMPTGTFTNVDIEPTGTGVIESLLYGANGVAIQGGEGDISQFLAPGQQDFYNSLVSAARHGNKQAKDVLDNRVLTLPLTDTPGAIEQGNPQSLAFVSSLGEGLAGISIEGVELRLADSRDGVNGFSASNVGEGLAGPSGPEGQKGGAILAPTPSNRWGVFLTGIGDFTNVGNTATASGYSQTTAGFLSGVDYRIDPHFVLGVLFGYDHENAYFSNSSNVSVDGEKLGFYGTYFNGGLYVNFAGIGGLDTYNTQRLSFGGAAAGSPGGYAFGNPDGQEVSGLFGTGYDWKFGNLSIGPTANFQYTESFLDSFTETSSALDLHFPDQSTDSTLTRIGAKSSYDCKVMGYRVTPSLRAEWQHEYGPDSTPIDFNVPKGTPGTIFGPKIGRDSVNIGTGFSVQITPTLVVYANYDGDLARKNYISHNISAGVRYQF